MENHTKFNKEILNERDLDVILETIVLARRTGGITDNYIYGLYDGYLYEDALNNVMEKIPTIKKHLSKLIEKIKNDQKVVEETIISDSKEYAEKVLNYVHSTIDGYKENVGTPSQKKIRDIICVIIGNFSYSGAATRTIIKQLEEKYEIKL